LFAAGDPNDATHALSPAFELGALAYRPGGTPAYAHRFYVDATPRAWDIDFANTNTSTPPQSGNDWRTVLIGGLGAGARAAYALNVTNPVAPAESESVVASSGRVLWEFTHPNLGYVFDAPTLVKTRRYGWVALIASGHNNRAATVPFVVNPANGPLMTLHRAVATPRRAVSPRSAHTANRNDPHG
jgi:type IV pilus assembly protein PilY1